MLQFKAISKNFGGAHVLDNVSFDVPPGSIFGIIGPNGAGKTTLFNIVTGLLKPTSGAIYFNDQALLSLPAHRITQMGLARTFQNIRVFGEMSVLENVLVGMHDHLFYGLSGMFFNTRRFRVAENSARLRALEILSWVKLVDKAEMSSHALSYGEQRKLELARALATEPKLLLLDEPVAGMNPAETDELMVEIRNINSRGYGIVLIEHDMRFVMGLCQQIAVLNFGKLIAVGEPQTIKNHPEVIEAYLGQA